MGGRFLDTSILLNFKLELMKTYGNFSEFHLVAVVLRELILSEQLFSVTIMFDYFKTLLICKTNQKGYKRVVLKKT